MQNHHFFQSDSNDELVILNKNSNNFRSFPVSQYQDQRTWKMTPSMMRARLQYFWPNFATLAVLSGVSFSIYVYTFHFLNKDELDDIEIPPISDEDLAKLKAEYEKDQKELGKA